VADRIWEIEDGELKDYKGDYAFYLEEKQKLALAQAEAKAEAEKQAAYAAAQAKKQAQVIAGKEAKPQEAKKRRYSPEEAQRLLPKVELSIREQETMMGLLETQMADPANHTDPQHSAVMVVEYDVYETKIAELMEKWEQLMEAAEEV